MKNQFKNRLYRLTWAVLASSLMLLSSCGDDEEEEEKFSLAAALEGTWIATDWEVTGCLGGFEINNGSANCSEDNSNDRCSTVTFNPRNFEIIFEDSNGDITTRDYITVGNEGIDITGGGFISVSLVENVLTMTSTDEQSRCVIAIKYIRQ